MKFSPHIVLFSLACLAFGYFTPLVYGQASVSPSPSPDSSVVTENLKQRLIETINQVDEGKQSESTLGFVGKVRDIVQNTIVIEDKTGKKNVIVNSETNIVRSPGSAEIKLENVRIDDGIIAIGDPQTTSDEIQGKRIIVSSELFSPPTKVSGIAKITKISKSSMTVSVIGTGTTTTLSLNSKTVYKSKNSSLELSDLSENDTVVYTALADSKDSEKLTATVILTTNAVTDNTVIPEEDIEPVSSPSATPKSSARVSPRPSPLE